MTPRVVRVGVALLLLAGLGVSRAAAAEPSCAIPDDLALGDIALPAAKAIVARAHRLVVATLGGAMTADATEGGFAARLEDDLAASLPGTRVEVVNRAEPGHGVAYTLHDLPAWLAATRPALVIWSAGAREAALGANPEAFAGGLTAGIAAIRAAGADVILLDLKYSPALAAISDTSPYRAVLRGVAAANDIPILDRYDMMMAWHESGAIDLLAETPQAWRVVARQVFSCLAGALAPPIAAALR